MTVNSDPLNPNPFLPSEMGAAWIGWKVNKQPDGCWEYKFFLTPLVWTFGDPCPLQEDPGIPVCWTIEELPPSLPAHTCPAIPCRSVSETLRIHTITGASYNGL